MIYEKLFSPASIGRLEIRNRVAMTPMGLDIGALAGGVNYDLIAFYGARAKGGVGPIISGVCQVMDGPGADEDHQLAARSAADIDDLGRLMDAVHKHGAKMFIQLQHPGLGFHLPGRETPVSASAVAMPSGVVPRALTIAEIESTVEAFVTGAQVAQIAGADGIE